MSYICLTANSRAITAAADSRVTFQPVRLGLHVSGRKVCSCPELRQVWTCCGLVVFGGIHYPSAAGRILRRKDLSLTTALRRIGDLVSPATRALHALSRQNSSFTLIVGRMTDNGPDMRTLFVENGKVTVTTHAAPVLLEAGWCPDRYPDKPAPAALERQDPAQLAQTAVRRVRTVLLADRELHKERKDWPVTVGGDIRSVTVV